MDDEISEDSRCEVIWLVLRWLFWDILGSGIFFGEMVERWFRAEFLWSGLHKWWFCRSDWILIHILGEFLRFLGLWKKLQSPQGSDENDENDENEEKKEKECTWMICLYIYIHMYIYIYICIYIYTYVYILGGSSITFLTPFFRPYILGPLATRTGSHLTRVWTLADVNLIVICQLFGSYLTSIWRQFDIEPASIWTWFLVQIWSNLNAIAHRFGH